MKSIRQDVVCPLLVSFLMLCVATGSANAQETETRTAGLTGQVNGGQLAILVPLWLGDTITLAPGFSLNYVESTRTNIGLMLAPRIYLDMRRVAPYIAGRVGVMFNMPNLGADTTDLMIGVGVGGEYFINPKFSLGVEGQINGQITDISGAGTTAISTGTAVHANVYF